MACMRTRRRERGHSISSLSLARLPAIASAFPTEPHKVAGPRNATCAQPLLFEKVMCTAQLACGENHGNSQ